MEDQRFDRKYEAFKIPEHSGREKGERPGSPARSERAPREETRDGLFYEIEYDAAPWPGVGKYVMRSARIQPPPKDEVRDRFNEMRDIARENSSWYSAGNKFYDGRVQRAKGEIFYKQGMFMKDFEDDYEKTVPYSSYYPFYQMMGYEQLRTYFTWRTKVRKGDVEETSVSYAFLYIYELLDNIGTESPRDGLERLLFFWRKFRAYDQTIDKYVLKWLKDYHVYYELPWSFKDFVLENDLGLHYPQVIRSGDDFERMCSISKYDLRKSVFYTEERAELIRGCFGYVTDCLRTAFEKAGMDYDECLFPSLKNMALWTPFQGALFFPWQRQRDRRVVLAENEIYVCSGNTWRRHTTLASESGRKLLGYVMKQMEAVLRKLTKYKYSITAGISTVNPVVVTILAAEGTPLEELITEAVREYYREATKTVVRVDPAALNKIRREAMLTQERLTVEEEGTEAEKEIPPELNPAKRPPEMSPAKRPTEMGAAKKEPPGEPERAEPPAERSVRAEAEKPAGIEPEKPADAEGDGFAGIEPEEPWMELKSALSGAELGALAVILRGENSLKQYADQQGIMLEVLADGINEKAMDVIGDSLLDDEFRIYEEYLDLIKEMVTEI